jgi:predicted Zn-dependent peptidase
VPDTPALVQRPGTTRTLEHGPDGGAVRRTVLPGGLRVVTESMPGARSASLGVWVGVGSRDETPSLAGTSHYLEHLLFKGTKRRGPLEISSALDAVGGELNAFTAKEHTCYYAHVLADDLPLAVDVVCDVVTRALIAPRDVEGERGVILEEIAMRDDDPADVVHDGFTGALFGDTPLGRPVIGTVDSVAALRRDQIAGYYRRRYRPPTMVVAAAGRVDHRAVVRLVRKAFGPLADGDDVPVPYRAGAGPARRRPATAVSVVHKETEQANVMLGTFGLARRDERRFSLGVLNAALGGSASSRLFQEVREKRGLVYSIYSYAGQYADAGSFGVYAGCAPGKIHDVLAIVREQLEDIAAHGLTDEEVARGKGQLRGALVLGLEDVESRMIRVGKGELSYGAILEVDDLLGHVDAVTPDSVREIAADVLKRPMCLCAVGPFDDHGFDHYVDGNGEGRSADD